MGELVQQQNRLQLGINDVHKVIQLLYAHLLCLAALGNVTSLYIVIQITFNSSAKNVANGLEGTGSEWYSSSSKNTAAILCAGCGRRSRSCNNTVCQYTDCNVSTSHNSTYQRCSNSEIVLAGEISIKCASNGLQSTVKVVHIFLR